MWILLMLKTANSKNGLKRVIVKVSDLKDASKIRSSNRNLRDMDLTSIGINNPVAINDSACIYYKMLWRNWKSLQTNKLIHSFWVTNGPIRLRTVENGQTNVITHLSDFEELYPGNKLLPSWHSDVVTTLSQHRCWRCHNIMGHSKMRVVPKSVSDVAITSLFDVIKKFSQRRHNIKHSISRPFYYRLSWFLSLHQNMRELQKCYVALNAHCLSLKERCIYS